MADTPSLRIRPDKSLDFQVSRGCQSHAVLYLENPHDYYVAFKIKTTAPKSYLVKPSSGVVAPQSTLDVNILLIPLFDQPEEPVTDRFLVQSTTVESDVPLSKEDWASISTTRKEKLEEKRLAVQLNWMSYPTGTSREVGGPNVESVSSILNRKQPVNLEDYRTAWDELLAFSVGLEKQKRELEAELDNLRRTMGSKQIEKPHQRSGMELGTVVLLVLAVVIVLKLISFV